MPACLLADMDDATDAEPAAGTSAAAAAAAAVSVEAEGGGPTKKRKVRRNKSTAEKLRLLHGKSTKLPAARFSLLNLAAPVETVQEQQLFWELYTRFTRGGSTAWNGMAQVWNFRAHMLISRNNFNVSLKAVRHLKGFHRKTTKSMLERANAAADNMIAAAGALPLATRLGLAAPPSPAPPALLPHQVQTSLFGRPVLGPGGAAAAAAATTAATGSRTAAPGVHKPPWSPGKQLLKGLSSVWQSCSGLQSSQQRSAASSGSWTAQAQELQLPGWLQLSIHSSSSISSSSSDKRMLLTELQQRGLQLSSSRRQVLVVWL
jgi:hypothetical protein